MKKIYLIISILIAFCTACKDAEDFLDPAGSTGLNKEIVFGNARNSEAFLMDIYRQILPVLMRTDNAGSRWRNQLLLETGTENGTSNNPAGGLNVRDFNSGSFTPGSTGMFWQSDWREYYAGIRACNMYLENVDNIPDDSTIPFTAATRKIRKAEVKWIMAFFYAELAKQFGGMPIITRVIDASENLEVARSTFDETIAFIVKLCDEAAVDLPVQPLVDPTPDPDLGRVTKGAALALKARMLLYAASPLWNDPANPVASNENGKYDENKWQLAAQAAQDVIALNRYSLHPDISTLFTTRTNNEIIFARMQEPMAYFTATHVPFKLFVNSTPYVIGGNNQVTYNMVKQYEILNGGVAYTVDDPPSLSGYNDQDPFKRRDPRFYRDNIYNGAKLRLANTDRVAEFGRVAPGVAKSPAHNTLESPYDSFVYSVKFCDLTLNITTDARNPSANGKTNQNYPYLRYAEVLLNYAEAVNEAYGPDVVPPIAGATKTARAALNEVRVRAQYPANTATSKVEYMGYTGGMPPIVGGTDKVSFRTKLQHERRVEFCYEEHWFWDFRRWKLTPETVIKVQIPVWTSPTTVRYDINTIETRFWNPKMYRMPIPESEVLANPKMVQNSGW
ncbi:MULTISPECIES: RagB/SusD family nutrient uptake outer membrane protein [Pedobacter]|nr:MULTISPECIES: RagB/SusD family nutrient uptake outer membrane protein [Pedobacter]MBB5441115.1 hypothetical protein [Pedobacter sp. AK017]